MKIIFGSDQYWPSLSGVCVSIDSFRKGLEAAGHSVFLIVPEYPSQLPTKSESGVYRFKSRKTYVEPENRFILKSEKSKIFQLLDSIAPDIIHIHTEFSAGKLLTHYTKKRNIPLVLTLHTNWAELANKSLGIPKLKLGEFITRLLLKSRYNQADLIIVPSQILKDDLSYLQLCPPITILPTGVDTKFFNKNNINSSSAILHKFPQLANSDILLYVGRLSVEKDIDFLMDAFQRTLSEHPHLKFVLAGNGPQESELKHAAMSKNIQHSVEFLGLINHDDLKYLYAISKIFIFASKVETQGLVILEAMSSNIPVVAINEKGTQEIMKNSMGGFATKSNLNEFVSAINQLLNDSELYKLKQQEAQLLSAEWSMDYSNQKLLNLYNELLSSAQS